MPRYSQTNLYMEAPGADLKQRTLFNGAQAQCLIMEKYYIYGHFFTHGELPPGNRIFR
jgi:hypothetical protein